MSNPFSLSFPLLLTAGILLIQAHAETALQSSEQHTKNSHGLSQVAASSYVRPGHHGMIFESEDIANIGFIIGTECVAVVDTGGSYTEGMRLLQAIRSLTATPICYVINTHVHPDHMLGNKAFQQESTHFVGHQNLPQALGLVGDIFLDRLQASKHSVQAATEIIFPDVLVSDTLQLDLGDRKLLLTAHDVAHTAADLSIYDPKDDVLWTVGVLYSHNIFLYSRLIHPFLMH